ncbi:hypothetical protein, partial [Streptomyces fildesensis]|uniref:hypothetical protein n=1 Tax=Streptomyces fildesensis TaxID=375757 RepID=UPI001E3D25E4
LTVSLDLDLIGKVCIISILALISGKLELARIMEQLIPYQATHLISDLLQLRCDVLLFGVCMVGDECIAW